MHPRRTRSFTGHGSASYAVPHPSTSVASSPGPATPIDRHAPGSGATRQPTNKKKKGNKKPPVSYPPGMRVLIRRGFLIWGQRIPDIGPFDPSHTVGQGPHYSVFHLATSESLHVTQMQAFSGRDDEVEEWGSQRLMPSVFPPSPTPSPSGVTPPSAIWNLQSPVLNPFGRDMTVGGGWHPNSWLDVPPRWNNGGSPSYQLRSSPLPSEASSMDSYLPSGECYAEDSNTEPPPSRSSTASYNDGPQFATPPNAVLLHQSTTIFEPYFQNADNYAYSGQTDFFAGPQQTQSTPVGFMSSPDDPFNFSAHISLQQHPLVPGNPFAPTGDGSAQYYSGSGAGGSYYGREFTSQ